jgi:hypothetical protein
MEREKELWPTSKYYGRIRYEELMKAAKTPHGQPSFQPRLVTGLFSVQKHILDGKEINSLSQYSIYLQLCLEISVNKTHTASVSGVVRRQLVMTLPVSSQEHVTNVRDYSGEKMRWIVNS